MKLISQPAKKRLSLIGIKINFRHLIMFIVDFAVLQLATQLAKQTKLKKVALTTQD